MKISRRLLLPILIHIFVFQAFSHENHESMKTDAVLPGSSIFQLDSRWKDQTAKTIKLSELRGKPQLLVMLFTKCETSCPLIIEDLKGIATELSLFGTGQINVSIFSLDSRRETPESLKAFAIKRKVPENWRLFTSSKDESVAELAAALGIRYKRLKNGDIIHSNVIYFLNAKGEVLAQKEGLKAPHTDFIKQIRNLL